MGEVGKVRGLLGRRLAWNRCVVFTNYTTMREDYQVMLFMSRSAVTPIVKAPNKKGSITKVLGVYKGSTYKFNHGGTFPRRIQDHFPVKRGMYLW